MIAKSLHETRGRPRAQGPRLPCPAAPAGTGLAGRACQQTVWEPGPGLKELAMLALDMTDEAALRSRPQEGPRAQAITSLRTNRQKPGELSTGAPCGWWICSGTVLGPQLDT